MITDKTETILMVLFGFAGELETAMSMAEQWLAEHCDAQDMESWTVEN